MEKKAKIYVAGHKGLIGSALVAKLRSQGWRNLIFRSRQQLDLTRQAKVANFFKDRSPEYVFIVAAKVGGIKANMTRPAEFIYENLAIQINLIQAANLTGAKKLLFAASACGYPKKCPQPMKESYLLTGGLEPTNEEYAIAKLAGIKMCQAYNRQYGTDYICPIFASVYGPGDNFDPETSHVIAALIRKFHQAKLEGIDKVVIWGTGKPRREFLYVDDAASAAVFLMKKYSGSMPINVGAGSDVTIRTLAGLIKEITGYKGKIVFDAAKPDGMPRKLLDVTRINKLGWRASIKLDDGLTRTYEWYKSQAAPARKPARQK